MGDQVNHPEHYGGEGNPYEAIRVIEAWGLGFCLGNAVKYIARAGKKGSEAEDLDKAIWYLKRHRDGLAQDAVQDPVQDEARNTNDPHPGEVLTLRNVHSRDFAAYYATAENGDGVIKKNVRLRPSARQEPPRAGDKVTVGEEGFTYIERAERGDA